MCIITICNYEQYKCVQSIISLNTVVHKKRSVDVYVYKSNVPFDKKYLSEDKIHNN